MHSTRIACLLRQIGVIVVLGLAASAWAQVGEVDHSFGAHGLATASLSSTASGDSPQAVKVYPTGSAHAGKIVVAGYGSDPGKSNKPRFVVARFNENGTLDTTFSDDGKQEITFTTEYDYCYDVLIQPDDKIVLVGEADYQIGVARLNVNGSLDTSFDGDGKLRLAVADTSNWSCGALQKDGKILVGGRTYWYNSTIVRLNANGSLDGTFSFDLAPGANEFEMVDAIVLDNGAPGAQNIFATGYAYSGGRNQMTAIKLNNAGVKQWSQIISFSAFSSGGDGIALYDYGSNGSAEIVIGGDADVTSGDRQFAVAVLNPDGSLYTGFNGTGKATVDLVGSNQGNNVIVQSDGKIIAGGYASGCFGLARFTAAGALDTTFSGDGISEIEIGYGYPYDFCLDNSNRIVCVGFTEAGVPNRDFAVVRVLNQDVVMSYLSSDVTQESADIFRGATGGIIDVTICANGATFPLTVTSFSFDTAGSTNPAADIASATLYYTGTDPTFAATNAFGSTFNNPNGGFAFEGAQTLAHGHNHFWLAYTTKAGATLDNWVDAECTAFSFDGTPLTPDNAAPAGARPIRFFSYPATSGDTQFNDILTNVTFAGINNTSGADPDGYTDFSAQTANVLAGTSYPFSCTIGGTWPQYPSYIKVWFDWNQDYTFDDPGEEYTVQANGLGEGPHAATIAVPADAVGGNTRMRVVVRGADYDNTPVAPPSQGGIGYGEAEDYTLVVTSPAQMYVTGNMTTLTNGQTTTSWESMTYRGKETVGGGDINECAYVIHSSGTGDLVLTGTPHVTVVGPNPADFIVVDQPVSPIAPGETAWFSVRFAPTASGWRTGIVSIASNDSDDNPYTFAVEGIGNCPPVITQGAAVALATGAETPVETVLNATDTEGSALTWSVSSQGSHGAGFVGEGANASAPVFYVPNAGFLGADTFTVRVADSDGAADTIAVNVNVVKGTPVITAWPTAGAIAYGQTLAEATLAGGSASVAGTFAFESPGTAPEVGTASHAVIFTPANSSLYNSVAGSVSVTVNKVTPTVTEWPMATGITYEQSLADSTLSGGSASVAGTFAFTEAWTVPGAGLYAASVTFSPSDGAHYSAVTGTVNVAVQMVTPTVNEWPTPFWPITYGQSLGDVWLWGGSASVDGEFTFDDPTTVPGAGTYDAAVTFRPWDSGNCHTVPGTVQVSVSKAVPNVFDGPAASDITYGQTLAESVLTGGSADAPGTFAWNDPTLVPGAPGNCFDVTFTPADPANYETVQWWACLNVAPATPVVSAWPAASTIAYGQMLADAVLSGGEASVDGAFAFVDPGIAPAVGTATFDVVFTPNDWMNHETVTGSVSVTVEKAAPTVAEWPTASAISYGQTLADSTLSGGSASVSGTFAFASPATAPDAGPYTGDVLFTPTDPDNYETVSGTVFISVEMAAPAVTEWPVAGDITYGQTLADSALTGGLASVPGAFAFDAPETAPPVGPYSAALTFTPTDSANYKAVSGTVQVNVGKATPIVSAWPTATGIEYGQTLASSSLSGGEASEAGTFAFADTTVAPDAGAYSASVVFTPADTGSFEVVIGTVSVTVEKATPTVLEWPTAGTITYGQALGEVVLTGGAASVPGTFGFEYPAAMPVAGPYTAAITFTPDDANYAVVLGSLDLTVHAATPTVTTWPTASPITYGQTLADSVLSGGDASTPGAFTFDEQASAPNAGTHTVAVTFIPADVTNYISLSGTIDVTVGLASPVISAWPTASAITYGQPVFDAALSGGEAAVPGTFDYEEPAAELGAGVHAVVVLFTPADPANYSPVTGTVNVTVEQAIPVISAWPTASALTYGQALADGTLDGGSASVAGTFAFEYPAVMPSAGVYEASVVFTPEDAANHAAVSGTVNVTVSKATPTLTAWPTSSSLTYGQTLADSVLSGGEASVEGTFAFDAPDTAPATGVYTAAVTFTPTDPANYIAVGGTVEVTVGAAEPEILGWPAASSIVYGQPLSASILFGGGASVAGFFNFEDPTAVLDAGVHSVTVVFSPVDTINYSAVSNAVDVTVVQATPSVSEWPVPSTLTYGQTLADATLSGGSVSVPGTFAFELPATIPNAGLLVASVIFMPEDTANYVTVSGFVYVTTGKATPTVTVWPTATPITYGTILANVVLNGGEASAPGTFLFNAPGLLPDAGVYTAAIGFLPEDTANYEMAWGTIEVTVEKALVTVFAWPSPSVITYGQTLLDATLFGGGASAPGAFAFDAPDTVLPAGTHAVAMTFTPSDANNYTTVSGTVPVTVLKAAPDVTAWPAASDITYGHTLADSTLTGGAASTDGTFVFDDATALLDAGMHNVAVTFTPADTANHETVSGNVVVTVNRATPTVTAWPTASAIVVGDSLAASALTGGSASAPGTFAFENPAITPNVGTYSAAVIFAPDHFGNYESVHGTVFVIVTEPGKVAPLVTWPSASEITYGQTCAGSVLSGGSASHPDSGASVPGTFAFAAPSTAPAAGTYTAAVVFTPEDTETYSPVSGNVSVTVHKATPTVSAWPVAASITLGQALNSATLMGGTASVPGSFGFVDETFVPTTAGVNEVDVRFTPTDAANYEAVVRPISVLVEEPGKITPAVTWPTATAITVGQSLADSALVGGSAVDSVTAAAVPGVFSFSAPETQPALGAYTATVIFTPADAGLYNPVMGSVTVQVMPEPNAAPEVPPIADKQIEEGQTLTIVVEATDADGDTLVFSAAQLPDGATFDASTATFAWTPAVGAAGVYVVTFRASDGKAACEILVTITVIAQPEDDRPETDLRAPVILAGPRVIEITSSDALIVWTTDELATGEVDLTADGQSLQFEEQGSRTDPLYRQHQVIVSGLTPGTQYAGRVASSDDNGNGPTRSRTFTFTTPAVTATPTLAFTDGPRVTYTSDTLAGIAWATDRHSVVTVEYGKAAIPPALTTSVSTNEFSQRGSIVLGALEPGTAYQLRVTATERSGAATTTSPIISFTTATEPDTTPPQIIEGPLVLFITGDQAVVYWVTNKPTISALQYSAGGAKALSGTLVSSEYALEHTVVITNLLPATNYVVNCTVADPAGNEAEAAPETFQTPTTDEPLLLPTFVGPVTVSEIGTSSALLSWSTDQVTDAYAVISDSQETRTVGDAGLASTHALRLTGLAPGTSYSVVVHARNTVDAEVESEPAEFTTAAPDTTPPALASELSVTVATGGASAILAWSATEPALARVACGVSPDALAEVAAGAGFAESGTLTLAPLAPGTTYYYAVTLTDAADNAYTCAVRSFGVSAPDVPARNGELALVAAGALAAAAGLAGGGGGGGGGGPCFIATAAYGTPLASQIDILREFRDTWLLNSAPGIAFVDLYYRVSPPISDAVAANAALRFVVRVALVPILFCAWVLLTAPEVVLLMVFMLAAVVAARARRKRVQASLNR